MRGRATRRRTGRMRCLAGAALPRRHRPPPGSRCGRAGRSRPDLAHRVGHPAQEDGRDQGRVAGTRSNALYPRIPIPHRARSGAGTEPLGEELERPREPRSVPGRCGHGFAPDGCGSITSGRASPSGERARPRPRAPCRRELRQRERPHPDHERSVDERELTARATAGRFAPSPARAARRRRSAACRGSTWRPLRCRAGRRTPPRPEAGRLEPPAQAAAGGADERPPVDGLARTGRLADEVASAR